MADFANYSGYADKYSQYRSKKATIDTFGMMSVAEVLGHDVPATVGNRILKNAMYRVVSRYVIPIIQAQIAEEGLIKEGHLYHGVTIIEQNFRNKYAPILVVGPGLMKNKKNIARIEKAIGPDFKLKYPYWAPALEVGTGEREGPRGKLKPYRFMLKSYYTVRAEYKGWLEDAIKELFIEFKQRELKNMFKKKKAK